MKTLKYELEELRERKIGLQFVHNYFFSYLVKAGLNKFDKMLAENDKKDTELLNRAVKEYNLYKGH